MIVDDEGADDAETAGQQDVAGTAYRETITSVDGFTRGLNGRVKFNKDTKKRRRENDEMEDVEMADGEAPVAKSKKNERKPNIKFGQEFKAKVVPPLVELDCTY